MAGTTVAAREVDGGAASTLEMESLMPIDEDSTTAQAAGETGLPHKWKRLLLIILGGCLALLLWDSIEIDPVSGAVNIRVKVLHKNHVHGSSGAAIAHRPPSRAPQAATEIP